MPKHQTKKEQIKSYAIKLLKQKKHHEGLKFSELVEKVYKKFSNFPLNTIKGAIYELKDHEEVYKPDKGLYQHIDYADDIDDYYEYEEDETEDNVEDYENNDIKESDFYQPFAEWLVNDLRECTKAIPLGGKKFPGKWGTPDVIGKWESQKSDIISVPTEIVSAEIKIDTRDLITAFGQACAYKLFSHKSYLVIPKNSPRDDILKLDSLCFIFGIGLVLFNSNNPENPDFEIRVRAISHKPDMSRVNEYIRVIEKELWS